MPRSQQVAFSALGEVTEIRWRERNRRLLTASPVATRCSRCCDTKIGGLLPRLLAARRLKKASLQGSFFLVAAEHGDDVVHGDNE